MGALFHIDVLFFRFSGFGSSLLIFRFFNDLSLPSAPASDGGSDSLARILFLPRSRICSTLFLNSTGILSELRNPSISVLLKLETIFTTCADGSPFATGATGSDVFEPRRFKLLNFTRNSLPCSVAK